MPERDAAGVIDAADGTPLVELVRRVRAALAAHGEAVLRVPDPDAGAGLWPGERRPDGAPQRSWRAWADLADGVGARLGTPRPRPDGRVEVRLHALPVEGPLRAAEGAERYGRGAAFARLSKLEHPGFLLPLLDGLAFARPPDGGRVLVLGCHRGDEIAALRMLDPPPRGLGIVGVDLATDALAEASARFPDARFLRVDANELPRDLGRFDLIVTIGLLQSPGVDDRRLVRALVQDHAAPAGGLVLGLPNGRFRGGEATFGARTRNDREVDLSLVVKDLAAHRRYLHQHGYRVRIGGRYDLLLSAVRRARA